MAVRLLGVAAFLGFSSPGASRQYEYLFLEIGKMPEGKIKKLMDRGFGFIEGERGDIFFHHSAMAEGSFETLQEGQLVEYQEGRGPKGPCAENVKVLA